MKLLFMQIKTMKSKDTSSYQANQDLINVPNVFKPTNCLGTSVIHNLKIQLKKATCKKIRYIIKLG